MQHSPDKKKHVIVGMSGGVDSSVAALLLLRAGYRVEGLIMHNWEDEESACTMRQDYRDAASCCQLLGIPLHRVNFAAEYWQQVFSPVLQAYQSGHTTPNPDILCNQNIKFSALLAHVKKLGADYIATGHYSSTAVSGDTIQLKRGLDSDKDQSYFLYTLGQNQLKSVLFPLGEMQKSAVRVLAKQAGLPTHAKKDSTGICFIGKRKFSQFIGEYIPEKPGDIVDETNRVIGQHRGLAFYTLGQRQGLGIGGLRDAASAPWHVLEKDVAGNRLIVGQGDDNPRLFSRHLIADTLHWCAGSAPAVPFNCTAKVRYRQQDQACSVSFDEAAPDRATVQFVEGIRAITPGQSIVFYQGPICLGGGIIKSKN